MKFIELIVVIAEFQSELNAVLPKIVGMLADSSENVQQRAMDAVNSFAAQGLRYCCEEYTDSLR
jgi:hypothetical protein